MSEKKTINIKLLLNKETKKLVFAQSCKDFVDVLLSFLALPIATIITLSHKKKSDLGSMDSLYQSVESLDTKYFETETCKSLLLFPKCSSETEFTSLAKDWYNSNPCSFYYRCPSWDCATRSYPLLSVVKNVNCPCGQEMSQGMIAKTGTTNVPAGSFMKGSGEFIITDDLCVRKVSITDTHASILREFGLKYGGSLEEKVISVGANEVSELLYCSLHSKTPLSDVFLLNNVQINTSSTKIKPFFIIPKIPRLRPSSKMASLTILVRKTSDKIKVLYALANADFLDFVLSFLTFPVGSAINHLRKRASIGSMNMLYKSVEDMSKKDPEMFEGYKDMLLSPKVARYHGCNKQLLKVEEDARTLNYTLLNSACFDEKTKVALGVSCKHGLDRAKLRLLNPKYPNTEARGGFLQKPMVFMITDDLKIEPHSPASCISYVNNLRVPLSELEERVVSVGEQEALSILEASVTSKTVLTDVFCKNPRRILGLKLAN